MTIHECTSTRPNNQAFVGASSGEIAIGKRREFGEDENAFCEVSNMHAVRFSPHKDTCAPVLSQGTRMQMSAATT